MPTKAKRIMNLEQRIRHDHGLSKGVHVVAFVSGETYRKALVEITVRGNVLCMMQPREGDMYASWDRIIGNHWARKPIDPVKVWPTKDPEFMAQFEPDAVVYIPL